MYALKPIYGLFNEDAGTSDYISPYDIMSWKAAGSGLGRLKMLFRNSPAGTKKTMNIHSLGRVSNLAHRE